MYKQTLCPGESGEEGDREERGKHVRGGHRGKENSDLHHCDSSASHIAYAQ